jgi:hypothetical protein
MISKEQHLQVKLKKVLVAMETKRTDFDNIRQDVKKVKKYSSDLLTFIGVNEMRSVVDGEVKKQKGAFNCLPSGNMSQPVIQRRPLLLA